MTESVELLRVRTRLPGGTWAVPSFGDGQYTDCDVPVVVSGSATYEPLAWLRSPISSTFVDARDDLEITLPQDHELAVALRNPEHSWQIEILRATALTRDDGHIDTSTTERIAIVRVSGVSIRGSSARVLCKSKRSMLERLGPRDRFVDGCRHSLYGVGCGVDPSSVQDSGTVTATSGGDILEAGLVSALGHLVGGYATCAGQTRLIIANAGDGTCKVDRPWRNIGDLVGETLVCVPGCNRNTTDCDTKFSNLANFGGLPTTANPWSLRKTWGEQ